jgi:hypothetical protein
MPILASMAIPKMHGIGWHLAFIFGLKSAESIPCVNCGKIILLEIMGQAGMTDGA